MMRFGCLQSDFRAAAVVALLNMAVGCVPAIPVNLSVAAAVPAGEARIWVYRLPQPSAVPEMPAIAFNGAIVGQVDLGGAFYRDVAPGNYHITNTGAGRDVNQAADVNVHAGDTAYVKIVQLDNWDEDEWMPSFVTFYAWPVPAATGRRELAACHLQGATGLAYSRSGGDGRWVIRWHDG
jgi:hypothetical protein